MWESDHMHASINRFGGVALTVLFVAILLPAVSRAQLIDLGANLSDLQHTTRLDRVWIVFGRVTTLAGDGVLGAKVKVDIGAGKPEVLETNAKGEFKVEYPLGVNQFDTLHTKIEASKDGYFTAHESEDLTSKGGVTREVIVVLREESENFELLTPQILVASLENHFRSRDTLATVPESARKSFERATIELFEEGSPVDAVSALRKSVNRTPDCINCRLLLCLANLAANSIVGADREQVEVDKLTSSGKAPRERAKLLYLAGVVATWRHENKIAVGFLQKALELAPSDPSALQELGRALLLQNNWEAADEYLEKAIHAGASVDAHLLRARALLEEGDADSADAEMQAYLGKRPVRALPLTARLTYLDLQQRLEVKSLGKVKSVVNESVAELTKAMPELKEMEVADKQGALPLILQKIGENVQAFFRDFPNTISEEDTLMEDLRANGKVKGSVKEKANYLLLARTEKWGVGLTEYRADPTKNDGLAMESRIGSMRTKGFASASVVFHPSCQSYASFRYLGRQRIDGRDLLVIAFAQQPEKAKMVGRFVVNGVSEPALVQGVAWADAQDYHIVRMRTDLLKPLPRVRLVRQTTEISYGEVHFKDMAAGVWLPQEVTVTVQWKGRTFRNSHHYSDFKLFNVGTEEKRKG